MSDNPHPLTPRPRWDTERRVQIDPEPESNREETHCPVCGERIAKCDCKDETEGEE